jgi:hypothetical protein
MKKFTLLDLITQYFIGKTLKYLIYNTPVTQESLVRKKKSNNVTNDQFDSGNPKYSMLVKRTKRIGYHMIFEESKIIKVETRFSGYERETWETIDLTLENDVQVSVELLTKIIEIDKNTIMFEY